MPEAAAERCRVAVVTGAGGALGRVFSRCLAQAGFAVVLNGRGAARVGSACALEYVAQQIRADGGRAAVCAADVSDPQEAARVADLAVHEFGGLDALVNAAGGLRDRRVARMSDEDFDLVVRSHLYGSFHMVRAAWPALVAGGTGRIVNVSSAAGLWGNPGQVNYAAAKLGVVGMTLSLAAEGARYGVAANAVAPLALTPRTARLIPEPVQDLFGADRVAPLIVRLVSAACRDNGAVYEAGGGLYRRVQMCASPFSAIGDPSHPCDPDGPEPGALGHCASACAAVAENVQAVAAIAAGNAKERI